MNIHTIRSKLTAAVDSVHGERLYLYALKDHKPDPSKAPMEIVAVLQVQDKSSLSLSPGSFEHSKTSAIHASSAKAFINRAQLSGYMPKKGDRLRALDRPAQPFFEVVEVDDRNQGGRIILGLGEL